MTLSVRDGKSTRPLLDELSLEFLSERIKVREPICERVPHEVKEINRPGYDSRQTLKGYHPRQTLKVLRDRDQP